jgi:hypothetical protein
VVSSVDPASMMDAFKPAVAVSAGIALLGLIVSASALVTPAARGRLAAEAG